MIAAGFYFSIFYYSWQDARYLQPQVFQLQGETDNGAPLFKRLGKALGGKECSA
jgi:hypothetical protein